MSKKINEDIKIDIINLQKKKEGRIFLKIHGTSENCESSHVNEKCNFSVPVFR